MHYPSLTVMRIITADRQLFEHTMRQLGLHLTCRRVDPLETTVQAEAVTAIASAISEDLSTRFQISKYKRYLKEMAERLGYLVMVEGPLTDWRKEEQALEKDARDLALDDPDLMAAHEAEFGTNSANSEGIGLDNQEELTGPAALAKINSDIQRLESPTHPPTSITEPW